ncbi:MAG: hypothetical protein EJNHJLOP_00005 [Methanophagales virus PBV082]|uniref:Uncharacterized protein n=1 Tax=Methanophagales virus PBV082 TaxID=3071307 RepID=A0AA46YJN8_9VIRU|nr:MAG: hypothetical protein QIT52_gp05 [Methanophagales virus PBV082]UYL64894.1 MAG: hypothetical protein EJNHJLOP_00005 [Methanophagales virus PBV082]
MERGGGDAKAVTKKDLLGKLMSKIAKGKKLTKRECELLSVAIDAAKKAKSEKSSSKRRRRRK